MTSPSLFGVHRAEWWEKKIRASQSSPLSVLNDRGEWTGAGEGTPEINNFEILAWICKMYDFPPLLFFFLKTSNIIIYIQIAPETIVQLNCFPLYNGTKAKCIQKKLFFKFWIMIFSWASNMQYDTLMMVGSGRDPQLPNSHEGKQLMLHSVILNAFFTYDIFNLS